MSYFRGRNYVWSDDASVHFWCATGDDGWDESGWAMSYPARQPSMPEAGGDWPSGVGVPQDIADDYVMLRLAELVESRCALTVMARALERGRGNGGALALTELYLALETALRHVDETM